MSGNHKRKRRDLYLNIYMTAASKLIGLCVKLGQHDKKFLKVSLAVGRLDTYAYCLGLYERRRREQRL